MRPSEIAAAAGANEHVEYLLARGRRLRPAPAPWADRVLTSSVAEWAFEVATSQIADVRRAYGELMRKVAMDEIALGIEQDLDEEMRLDACA